MRPLLFSLFIPLFCASLVYSFEDQYLREPVRNGINAIYDLDYSKAQKIFDQLKTDHPDSPVGYAMTAIRAWHELLFASRNLAVYKYGIPTPFDDVDSESRPLVAARKQEFLDANHALQNFCDKLLKKNPNDVLALYFKGVSFENLSTQELTLERHFRSARSYAEEAEGLHDKVLQLNPNLTDAKTSSAVLQYVVGSFSAWVRWPAHLVGIHGDKKAGTAKLQEVSQKGFYRDTDAKVVFALLEAWRGDRQRAISLFKDVRSGHPRSFLCDISLAVGYEEAGSPKSAIGIYQELLRDMKSKAPGVQPGEIHLRIGKNYAALHDNSLALEQLQKAVQSKQSDAETKPLAYYEMARIYESRGEKESAKEYYRQAVKYGGSMPLIEKQIKNANKKAR